MNRGPDKLITKRSKREWTWAVSLALVLCVFFLFPAKAGAQETQAGGTAALAGDTAAPAPTLPEGVVPVADLFSEAKNSETKINDLLKSIPSPPPEIQKGDSTEARIKESKSKINKLRARKTLSLTDVSSRIVEWQREREGIDALSKQVGAVITAIQGANVEIGKERERWKSTLEAYGKAGYSGPTTERIDEVIKNLDKARADLDARFTPLIEAQKDLSGRATLIDGHIDSLNEIKSVLTLSLWAKDKPAFFEADFIRPFGDASMAPILEDGRDYFTESRDYLGQSQGKLGLQLVILLGVWLWLRTVLPHIRKRTEDLPRIKELRALFSNPFSVALLIVFLPSPLVYSAPPLMAKDLYWLIMAIPVINLLVQVIKEEHLRFFIAGVGVIFGLEVLNDFLASSPPLDQVDLVARLAIGLAISLVYLAPSRLMEHAREGRWERLIPWFKFTQRALVGLLALALLGQILGYNWASAMLARMTFKTVYVSFFLLAGYRVARSFVVLALFSDKSARLKSVKGHEIEIMASVNRLLGYGFVLLWIYLVAVVWGVGSSFLSGLSALWGAGFEVGASRVTVGLIFGSILAIYLSVRISRFTVYMLDEEIYPRRNVEKGLQSAINQGLRYAIVFIGFVVSLFILGVRLQSLAIVAGALGVGIGFGLQNVVNHFVAGLIMLVERPVKVGDNVVVGGEWCVVKRVGIRATLMETWDESEFIVPNGDLLWSNLTNWTYSHGRNRIHISVGVEYGSDPEKVIEILEAVGAEHPEILTDPAPSALFTGFGDSSLDFELRCFLPSINRRLSVASELRVAIYNALNEAGIGIPFPQRDIWIKGTPRFNIGAKNAGDASGEQAAETEKAGEGKND